jgi:hypothetical protein
MKQLKPVVIKTLYAAGSIEDVRAFDTLKVAYEAFSGDLTVKDYHSFRGAIYPYGKASPYNVITLKHVQDKLRLSNVEWVDVGGARQLGLPEDAIQALKEKNFFEARGKYGHLKKAVVSVEVASEPVVARAELEASPASAEIAEPVLDEAPAIDVVANKAAFEAVYKAINKVYHGKHVKLESLIKRFSLTDSLPEAPAEIRELAILSWASDIDPTAEQKALIGF